jgi:hypothetical protein
MNIEIELDAFKASSRALAARDMALEAKACDLMKKYGLFLPRPAKEFFRELADHLNWQQLKKAI